MKWDLVFFLNSALLGVGLAMDAFSVSLANGLNEPGMRRRKSLAVAGVFAFFQALMPMAGWICVHTIVLYFRAALRRTTPKRITIPLVCVCLFFGGMGLSDIGKDPFGVALGLAVALPLLLEILLRLRSRKFPEPIERKAAPVRYESKPEPQPAPRPVKICPHCGAPGRGDICEYCGGPI